MHLPVRASLTLYFAQHLFTIAVKNGVGERYWFVQYMKSFACHGTWDTHSITFTDINYAIFLRNVIKFILEQIYLPAVYFHYRYLRKIDSMNFQENSDFKPIGELVVLTCIILYYWTKTTGRLPFLSQGYLRAQK